MYVNMKILPPRFLDEQPYGTARIYDVRDLEIGDLVAFRDPVTLVAHPWRIMNIDTPNDERGGTRVRFRDATADPDPLSGQGEEISARFGGKQKPPEEQRDADGKLRLLTGLLAWKIIDHDWPVGYLTGEMLPTAQHLWDQINEKVKAEEDLFSMPGFCPFCGEAVTQRQHKTTFDTNLVIPGGPPVTFHIRQKCWELGGHYQAKLKQIDRDIAASIDEIDEWSWES